MILSSEVIRTRIQNPAPSPDDWLAITPVLNWDSQAKPGTAAIDVRLGQKFRIMRRGRIAALDHLRPMKPGANDRASEVVHVSIGEYLVLHPRQFVVGETLEWIRLPRGVAANVSGRSSWGRAGLIIATATGVHPGFAGILALEITNLGEVPLRLYPGAMIAQLFLQEVTHLASEKLGASAFMAASLPISGDPLTADRPAISALRELRRDDGCETSVNRTERRRRLRLLRHITKQRQQA